MAHRNLHMQLPVVLVNSATNFVSVPSYFSQSIRAAFPAKSHGVVALRIGWMSPPTPESGGLARPTQAFVGWSTGIADGHYLQVPFGLAESLGLKDALDCSSTLAPDTPLLVSVAVVPYSPVAARVDIDPISADDWEVLQLHANYVEEELLSQICVMGPGQKFPMWIHGHTKINMQVSHIALTESGQALCVRLARNTEVVVAPKLREKADKHREQSLRQNEIEGSQNARGYQLRVADFGTVCGKDRECYYNAIIEVHPLTLKRMSAGAGWPKFTVRHDGTVVYASDSSKVLIVSLSNRKRPRILEHMRKSKKDNPKRLSPSASLVSGINRVYVTLRVNSSAALGHVVLSRTTQLRCKVSALDSVILALPRFEPILVENTFPALNVRLTPILGHEEAQGLACGSLGDEFRIDTTRAAQAWQRTPGGPVTKPINMPLTDGMILALTAQPYKCAAPRTMYFHVKVDQPSISNGNTLEPVHWLVTPESRIEWQVDKVAVDSLLQKVCNIPLPMDGVPRAEEDMNSDSSQAPSSRAWLNAVLAQGISAHNGDYYAHLSMAQLGSVDSVSAALRQRTDPVLNSAACRTRICLGAPHPGGLYLCGGRGSGKTTVAQALARDYRTDAASLTQTVWVDCASLRGGKRSEVEHAFSSAFSKALSKAPSLLVFDDLDLLLPAPAGGDGGGASGGDAQMVWLAEWLEDLLCQYQSKLECFERREQQAGQLNGRNVTHRSVTWIATGREKRSLRASLLRTGLFDTTVEIPPLTANDRTLVLEAILRSRECAVAAKGQDRVDLDEIAARAEGYAPADFNTLTERALHNALIRELEEIEKGKNDDGAVVTLLHRDFEAALDGFTPAALRGVSLAKSDTKWSDVGGLETVRKVLKETLELPIQFAALYERSPQRLASGILLYGPPGCGKTLLAGAVAKECGLNFISVKGPEVLNKYIGASEQAVRDLFARAAAAAPSIVFFDEFDAVAPRRGNDSSGVTDRVVNQLLTFLDGVESRSGVYVMAATSRPDLVDPALLRPGRLDKQLLCGFPDAKERADILRTIAAKMDFATPALECLDDIAAHPSAELFTGADCQAVLYSAQLSSIHQDIPRLDEDGAPPEMNGVHANGHAPNDQGKNLEIKKPVVEVSHIHQALSEARPSVSLEDRERFNRIYDAFKGDRGADFDAVSGFPDGKLRTALK